MADNCPPKAICFQYSTVRDRRSLLVSIVSICRYDPFVGTVDGSGSCRADVVGIYLSRPQTSASRPSRCYSLVCCIPPSPYRASSRRQRYQPSPLTPFVLPDFLLPICILPLPLPLSLPLISTTSCQPTTSNQHNRHQHRHPKEPPEKTPFPSLKPIRLTRSPPKRIIPHCL